jgi:hypothetical protein
MRDGGDRCRLCPFYRGGGRAQRIAAANWSGLWYLLSSYAVISYTDNWAYVAFAAIGSWIGAFLSLSFQRAAAPARTRPGSAVD